MWLIINNINMNSINNRRRSEERRNNINNNNNKSRGGTTIHSIKTTIHNNDSYIQNEGIPKMTNR